MKVTEWTRMEYDRAIGEETWIRYVVRDDGVTVEQIATKKQGCELSALKLCRQQRLKCEYQQPRQMTEQERRLTIARRGRGMGIEPSTVVVSLANNPTFFASVSTDVEGGLGTVERMCV